MKFRWTLRRLGVCKFSSSLLTRLARCLDPLSWVLARYLLLSPGMVWSSQLAKFLSRILYNTTGSWHTTVHTFQLWVSGISTTLSLRTIIC